MLRPIITVLLVFATTGLSNQVRADPKPDSNTDCFTLVGEMLDTAAKNQCQFPGQEWTADGKTLLDQCMALNHQYGDNNFFADMVSHDQDAVANCHPASHSEQNCHTQAQKIADDYAESERLSCGLDAPGPPFWSGVAALKAYCDQQGPAVYAQEMQSVTQKMGLCEYCNAKAHKLVSMGKLFSQYNCVAVLQGSINKYDTYLYGIYQGYVDHYASSSSFSTIVQRCMKEDSFSDMLDIFESALNVCMITSATHMQPSSLPSADAPRLGLGQGCPPDFHFGACSKIIIPLTQVPAFPAPAKQQSTIIKLMSCSPGYQFDSQTFRCVPIPVGPSPTIGPSPTDTQGCPPGTVPRGHPMRCVYEEGLPLGPPPTKEPPPCIWNMKGDPPPCFFPPCPLGSIGTPGHCTQITAGQKRRPCPQGTIGSFIPNCRPIILRGSPNSIEQRSRQERKSSQDRRR